jgi:hypothetical protein
MYKVCLAMVSTIIEPHQRRRYEQEILVMGPRSFASLGLVIFVFARIWPT